MKSDLLVAIIGFIGVIFGSLITAYSEEIKQFVKAKNKIPIIGRWKATWQIEGDSKSQINDLVKIKKVKGSLIYAQAENDEYGDYEINGRISGSNLITLNYKGKGQDELLGGVMLLKLNPVMDTMEGKWMEFSEEGIVIGGETKWEKI
jgi:hypothetical protein